MTAVGLVLVVVGALLSAVAAVGVVRLPDALLRANAATKASSLGVVCVLAGVALLDPSVRSALTLAAAAALLLVTAPVAGHVIGHAAHRAGVLLWRGTTRHDSADPPPTD